MGGFQSQPIKPTVPSLDPNRYSGDWWELAKYPNIPFEKGCTRASATYVWNSSNKTISVINTCYKNGSPVYQSKATAKNMDQNYPGRFSIKFENVPFVSDYWIHWTDYDKYAIIGGPGNKFLWILSRQKVVPAKDLPYLLNLVSKIGYDPDLLMADRTAVSD